MVMIVGGYSTDDCLRRLENAGRQHGYKVEEWLTPSVTKGVRVAATMVIAGVKHGLGFKWDGADLNVLAERCMSLDYAMSKLPEMVAKGKGAPWVETEH